MLADFFISIINFLIDSLANIANIALAILPPSPFQVIDNSAVAEYLPFFNWFIPVESLVALTAYWLTAIALYYVVAVILRWVKIIE